MKRVKAGCILQTLVFLQKDDCGLSKEAQLQANRAEVEKYQKSMDLHKTRYQILDTAEQADGSVIVHVKKQLNDKTDVSEYFN